MIDIQKVDRLMEEIAQKIIKRAQYETSPSPRLTSHAEIPYREFDSHEEHVHVIREDLAKEIAFHKAKRRIGIYLRLQKRALSQRKRRRRRSRAKRKDIRIKK